MQALRSYARRASVLLVAGSTVATLIGCSGGFVGRGDNPPSNSSPSSFFANRSVSGTATLDPGKTGTLSLNTSSDGRSASGTVVVAGLNPANRAVAFSLGSFGVSGSVDPTTGEFSLNGTNTGAGPVTITGTLPTTSAAGSFRISAQGENFDGTLPRIGGGTTAGGTTAGGTTSGGTTSGGTTSGGTTGGGTTGGGTTSGGTTSGGTTGGSTGSAFSGTLTVSDRIGNPVVAGNSITPTDPSQVTVTRTTNVIGNITSNVLSTAFNQVLGSGLNIYPTNSVTLTVADFDGALSAGDSYSAIVGPDILNPFVNYSKLSVIVLTGVGAQKAYTSHSGTISIQAISSTSVTLQASNVLMQSITGDPTAGPGTFKLNGTLTIPVTTQ